MDGTVVDSEPYWMAAEHELVGEFGGVWTDALAHSLVGNSLIRSAQIIQAASGIPLAPEDIVERLLDKVVEQMRADVPWRPGARELLVELRDLAVPCALVTMSYRRLVDAFLAAVPAGAFSVIVTGDEVTHGKPHPEPYLTAAHALGVSPEECVALEDSIPGVTSAVAAGVPTIGIRNLVPVPALAGVVELGTLEGVGARDLVTLVSRLPDEVGQTRAP